MWLIILITLANGLANNQTIVLKYRLQLGTFPVNIFDGLTLLGLLVLPFAGARALRTGRPHRLLLPTLGVFGAALTFGLLMAAFSQAPLYAVATDARDFAQLPLAILIGYGLLARPLQVPNYLRVQIAAGVGTALLIMLFFVTGHRLDQTDNLSAYRSIAYVSCYAGLAVALLVFTIASGIKILPTILAVPLVGICLLGQIATLSRSDWVAVAAAVFAISTLLPAGRRLAFAGRLLLAGLLLVAAIAVGLQASSKATGVDFAAKMSKRIETLMPGGQSGMPKAWDSRIYAAGWELSLWTHSPIITGQGFAIQSTQADAPANVRVAFRHNSWTNTLATTGLLGFAAMCMVMGGCIVVGRRMFRDGIDESFMLIGAFALATGVYFIVHGLCTQSFDNQRIALELGLTFGVALRTRAMQQAFLGDGDGTPSPHAAEAKLQAATLLDADPMLTA